MKTCFYKKIKCIGLLLGMFHAWACSGQQITPDPVMKSYDFDFKALSIQSRALIPDARFTIVPQGKKNFLPLQIQAGKATSRLDSGQVYYINVAARRYETAQFTFDAGQALRDGRRSVDLFLMPEQLVSVEVTPQSPKFRTEEVKTTAFEALKKGAKVTLQHIFFDQSSPVLRQESYAELDKLANALTANPELRIEIRGHTDNTGDFEANVKLSSARCKSVAAYLAGKGISKKRLRSVGLGPRDPVAPNNSEENKKKNRRVEFVVL